MFGFQHPCGGLQPFVTPVSDLFLTSTDIRHKCGAQACIQANTQTHKTKINKPFKEKIKQKLPEGYSNSKSYMYFRICKPTSQFMLCSRNYAGITKHKHYKPIFNNS